ncbi:adenine phosphoribosyltransferase-like [Sycon ciliatum]|uniref:adenine phosphoribosyltransferase-like n=1 Tax=Sycon ciliatum TaxID=27933 RepID=UPI0020A919EE|eukprot:scpid81717/ scgid10972/ Adenine phosphoribosyltransferase
MADLSLVEIEKLISQHPDFPKPGILFRDVFPVLRDPHAFKSMMNHLLKHIRELYCQDGNKVDVVVGLDSRGFLFAPLLALELGAAFVPVRKKGKLPGETSSLSYTLEYGTAEFEIQNESIKAGQRVIVVDDLLATGGTMSAGCQLVQKTGGTVLEAMVIIELVDLKGADKVTSCAPVFSLFKY